MKSFLRRAGWLFLAVLFFGTGVGVGIYYFWQNIHQSKSPSQSQTSNPNELNGKPLANFTPIAHLDSLQRIDLKNGTGAEAQANSTVTVNYTGALSASGLVFQSSLDTGQPVTLGLSQVIKGWQEGIPGMKVGGQRRLLIPAAEGYGTNPPPGSGIPVNANLVFDVELLSVQ